MYRAITPIRELDDHYLLGTRLGVCEQTNNPSRPVLRHAVHIETREPRIIKIIEKSKVPAAAGGDRLWRRLCETLMRMKSHRNVMRIYDVYEDNQYYYIILERFEGCELFEFLLNERAVPELMCKYITRQILEAVSHMHTHNLLHRDIKPENVMFKHPKDLLTDQFEQHAIALIDFDTCRMIDIPSALYNDSVGGRRRLVGTYGYLAPEVLKGGEYTKASDMWSVGVILYILMTGVPPVPMDSMNSAKESLLTLSRTESDGIDFDLSPLPQFPKARDLCVKLLDFDPSRRLREADEALTHPWVSDKSLLRGMTKSHRSAMSGHSKYEENESHISHPFLPKMSDGGHSCCGKFDDYFKVSTSIDHKRTNVNGKMYSKTQNQIYKCSSTQTQGCYTPSTATPGSRPNFYLPTDSSEMKFNGRKTRDHLAFTDCESSSSGSVSYGLETPVACASSRSLKSTISNSSAYIYESPSTCPTLSYIHTHAQQQSHTRTYAPPESEESHKHMCKTMKERERHNERTHTPSHTSRDRKSSTHRFISAIPKVAPSCLNWIWDKRLRS